VKIKRRTKMGIRKISLIIGIAVVILGLNYLLNLYNEKFVDVNSKDYIIEQFTKENIGNKKDLRQIDDKFEKFINSLDLDVQKIKDKKIEYLYDNFISNIFKLLFNIL
jgi:hypothetical protein